MSTDQKAVGSGARVRLRALARRLPGSAAYERRIAELTAEVHRLARPVVDEAPMFVRPGHFYSPIPPLDEIRAQAPRLLGADPTNLAAVDLGVDRQRALLDALAPMVASVPFTDGPDGVHRYHYGNFAYGYADGMFLHLVLRHLRPSRLIELGSGYSSACTLDTLDQLDDHACDLTFVDPYPELLLSLLRAGDEERITILPKLTQDVDLSLFETLRAGDVLFVDSTHVARAGSDVCRLVFDILPALAPGVVVHLHDIFPRFEYPLQWIEEGRAWNEAYVLRAFLQYNEAFEVYLWPSLLHVLDPADLERRFPPMAVGAGGALWLRKVR